jgi:carboxyl-terminal processing protease
MNSGLKRFSRHFLILLSLGVVFFFGYKAGKVEALKTVPPSTLTNQTTGQSTAVDFSTFWKVWNTLNEKYVPSSTSTPTVYDQEKVWGAIQGLTDSLGDPYTVFFPPKESEAFASDIRGNFGGVGMEVVAQNGYIVVISPLKGSPAERAGMLPGDRVIKIDDKDTTNLTTEDAVNLIRGEQGTTVTLQVVRTSRKQPFEVKIVRDTIDIPTINTKDLGNGIFKIDLYNFSANSSNLFRGALREFVQSGDSKLILDLRGNPGGYLEAAIDMASWFLPSGKIVVRENFGPDKEETVYRSRGYDIFNDNLKFVILVDGGSASASEILAGALAEHHKATLVGEKTFGKGSVQELIDITPNTSLKVTVARWFTPNGLSISKQGIVPDVQVGRTEEDFKAGKDPQLSKAIEILNSKK